MSQPVSIDASSATLTSPSAAATRDLAAHLARFATAGDLICLWGELGAGKTVFAKGFGEALGINDVISSPTFVLMAEYAGRLPLFHIDLYRLSSAEDALAGGLLDERQRLGVTLVEWPERLGSALPVERLDVRFDGWADTSRRVTVSAGGLSQRRFVAGARDWDAASVRVHRPAPRGTEP